MRWLGVDVSYLAYRAFHSMGKLSFGGESTQIPFGIIKTIRSVCEEVDAHGVATFFDRGRPKRKDLLPEYKANRKKRDEDEEARLARKDLKVQIGKLHNNLKGMGDPNVFSQDGYEADDLLAAAADAAKDYELVILSTDTDLYQLLSPTVTMWDPNKNQIITEEYVRNKYGIGVGQWADVKALAGDTSDNIKGIPGVGIKTAVKFLSGNLTGKKFETIVHDNGATWERNLELVRLPMSGTMDCTLTKTMPLSTWGKRICTVYGINSVRFV